MEVTLVDLVMALGIAFVLPAGVPGRWTWWAGAGVTSLAACAVEPGGMAATALSVPLAVVIAVAARRVLPSLGRPSRWGAHEVAAGASLGYAAVAWAGLAASCAGLHPFGVADPFNQLAAVHFTFVGGGAVPLAASALAHARRTGRPRTGAAAFGLTVAAPPLVGLGFVLDRSELLVVGAVLLTVGVWCTGALELHRACDRAEPTIVRVLLAVSGVAVVAPMVLAVAWALDQHWDVPALSIQDMVRTHGAGNALGFVAAGLLAIRLGRANRPVEHHEEIAWR